jgi:dTDP-4-amino-4,6-dideoxygalactose transaminase
MTGSPPSDKIGKVEFYRHQLGDDEATAWRRVLDTLFLTLGPQVAAFEEDLGRYLVRGREGATPPHVVGTNSCSMGLVLALRALGVKPGDEVITTPMTFAATTNAILHLGATPRFVDVEAATGLIDPEAVRAAVGPRTVGILPVHLYGQLADMQPLLAEARRYGLKVIEDAAQAIGAADAAGRRAGSLGDVGCLSFFPTKNLGAFGDAGMCVTADGALAERLAVLRVHGGKPKYYHALIGGNFRIDELQAAVLNVKLPHLDAWSAARQRNAHVYDAAFARARLAPAVRTPAALPGARHIYNQYALRAERRDELRAYLGAAGVGTEIYYPVPLHLQQCFAYLGCRAGDFPHAEAAAQQMLALPIYPELSETQLQYVVDTIAAFYR